MIQPLILLIDTATEVCSVGICRGNELLALRESHHGTDHAALITIFIKEVASQAKYTLSDLDAVAVSNGPGSYTALRIGASVAKGICFGLQKPLLTTDTLTGLAIECARKHPDADTFFPMIDARRMEVYGALFDNGLNCLMDTRAQVLSREWWEEEISPRGITAICGSGAQKAMTLLENLNVRHVPLNCSATQMIPLALQAFEEKQFADIAYYTPFYLKPPNITQPKKKV